MISTFEFLDYVKNKKHLLQPVEIQFRVAALLHNTYVCLHQPQVTQCFQNLDQLEPEENEENPLDQALLEPPTLIEYFHDQASSHTPSRLPNLFYDYNLACFHFSFNYMPPALIFLAN